jgi:hypothetical protein
MRNANDRSNERARESAADAVNNVRAGAPRLFEQEQARLDKLHDRVRDAVEAQLEAAGAAHSPLAEKAAQRLDTLRADQTARLRESLSREKQALDRQQSATPAVGDIAGSKAAEQALNEIRDLTRARDELVERFSEEAARVRDAITQDIQRQPVAGADAQAQRRRDDANRTDRANDATAVINQALNQQENNLRDSGNPMIDAARVADVNKRLENAEDRNRKQIAVIEGVRQEAERERAAAGGDLRKRAALDRDVAALDQRLEAYRAKADALRSTATLIEQQRIDLAERFLDQVKLADGGRRRSLDKDLDRERVDKVRQTEQARGAIERASQFAVLDRKFSDIKPIKELWDRAAAVAKEDKAQLTGRKLYEKALDQFKSLLANEKDETAREARALFEKDGLRFARDEQGKLKANLPMLDDPYVRSRLDMTRHSDILRVSGQHLIKLEDNGDPVDPANLAFMFARDNMQMDVKGPLSEYVRQKVVERMRTLGLEEGDDV